MAFTEDSRLLLATSLSVARVKNDDAGNVRLTKDSKNNKARDDVAAALTLAAGGFARAMAGASGEEEPDEDAGEVFIAR